MSRLASLTAALLFALPAASFARSPVYATPKDPQQREMAKCVQKCTDKIVGCSKKCNGSAKPKPGADPANAAEDPSLKCVQRCEVDAGRCMEACNK